MEKKDWKKNVGIGMIGIVDHGKTTLVQKDFAPLPKDPDIIIVGTKNKAREAIAKVFTQQKQDVILVDSLDKIRKEDTDILYKKRPSPPMLSSLGPIHSTRYCPGRHTYVKSGSGWSCKNCGRML